jgi:ABC-type transport system involved in multi-copper enzyme maturation permease subunit
MQTWAIIVDSFRETRDKKLFWVLLGLSTIIGLGLGCVGFDEKGWSFFFGVVTLEHPTIRAGTPAAAQMMAAIVSEFLVGVYIGWLGVILCLLGTAGMFPTLMQRGAIEVTLGKPLSRFKLFFAKYAGSLIFVLVQVTYFVLLTLIVIRWQLNAWMWAYLWAIPLLVIMFSYIYCVCVLAAVWSRSALTSLIVGMLFWFVVFSAASLEGVYTVFAYAQGEQEGVTEVDLSWENRNKFGKATFLLRTVLPKTDEIPTLLGRQMNAASPQAVMGELMGLEDQLSPQDRYTLAQEEKRLAKISPLRSIGSSLLFEVVILLLAWWRFQRKDF